MTKSTSSTVSTSSSTSTNNSKGNMKRNRRNRTSKRDVDVSSVSSLGASVRGNVEKELAEDRRQGEQTFEDVCNTFPGLSEHLDSLITTLLTDAGVLNPDTMSEVENLSDRESWVRQSCAHKGGVAVMKAMLNRVPKRNENGEKIYFPENHRLAGKPVMTRVGSRTLPNFNASDSDPHGRKLFTTTECAAIHGAFWRKWEQHPVVARIVGQHNEYKTAQEQRRIDAANRGRKGAKQFTVDEVASAKDVRAAKRGQESQSGGYKIMSAALESAGKTPAPKTKSPKKAAAEAEAK